MNRAKYSAILILLVCGGAWAQVSSVTVGLTLPGPIFIVDGQQYNSQQLFLWPQGSKHIVQYLLSVDELTGNPLGFQAANGDVARWSFGGWTTNIGLLGPASAVVQTVTATPGLTSIIGNVSVQYKITVQFYNTPGASTGACAAPGNAPTDGWRYGIVYVDGSCVDTTTDIWTTAGVHTLNAFPYPGFAFTGWLVDGGAPNAYLSQFTLRSTTVLIPLFMPAKRVKFRTNPAGLQVVVDHTILTTPPPTPTSIPPGTNVSPSCQPNYSALPPGAPRNYTPLCIGDFDFLPGTAHQVGAPTPQMDAAGKYWVFSGFSNGLKQNDTYVTDQRIDLADTVYANFVPGVQTSITTVPNGLKLQIDGRDNWPSYNFVWGEGETHHLVASATQTDAHGRAFQFVAWSNKGAAAQDITIPVGSTGMGLTATYQGLGQVQISSNPAGLNLSVDGSPCTTPCVVNRLSGAQLTVAAPASIPNTQVSRYDFDNWTGGTNSPTLQVTFDQNVQSLTANYHAAYLLTSGSNPAGAATFKLTPPSPDGFFADGTTVSVTPVPKGGYKFVRWGGDLSGGLSPGYLTMSGPHGVSADFVQVPFIAPAGIINAAGNTPDGSVAPGSIITIFGQNLAGAFDVGPVNPLAQAIDNVTVTVNNQLMPLFFISPSQINAQVPSSLADGDYTLTVHWVGQADVSAPFTVRRNAPGVFTQSNPQNLPLALALHEDGTQVTPDSPAIQNETISLYGTGFGPYDQPAIDGFPIPDSSVYKVADPVTVLTGSLTLTPDFAGAAAGMVGTTVVRLKITSDLPSSTVVDMAVSVNGKQSSVVKLPLQ